MKRIGHEIVAMYQYLIPVIATTAAIILKMDTLQWFQPVAAVILLAGVFLTSKATDKAIEEAKTKIDTAIQVDEPKIDTDIKEDI